METPKITNVDLNKELEGNLTFKNANVVESTEMQNYAGEGQLTEIQERQTQIEKLYSKLDEVHDAWDSLNKAIENLYLQDTYLEGSIELNRKVFEIEKQISSTENLIKKFSNDILKNKDDIDKLTSSN